MNDAIFNARLQAIESAFRHLAEIRLELEQAGIWKKGTDCDFSSDFYQFFMEISCKLSSLYLEKEIGHE